MLNKKILRLGTLALILFLVVVIFLNTTSIGRKYQLGMERFLTRVSYWIEDSFFTLTADANSVVKLDIPFHHQEHSLSCEVAALKMALNYLGVAVTESELIKNLSFDKTGPISADNIWGDPEKGFVGSIDGSMPRTGYGVYEIPIANLASEYNKQVLPLQKASLTDVLQAVFEKRAVIVWGYTGSGTKVSWKTDDGQVIQAVFGEHARVISGFSGTADNPSVIWLMDPVYGRISMSRSQFLKNWATLDNRAVIVY